MTINKNIKYLDILLLISMVILITVGVIFIYSGTKNSVLLKTRFLKQILFGIIGLILGIAAIFFDYKKLGDASIVLYGGLIVFLIITLIFGKKINGARSWLGIGPFGIQVSELGKIVVIILLAKFISLYEKDIKYRKSIVFFFITGFLAFIPVVLILIQPDFGTIVIYFSIFVIMAFIGGLNRNLLISLVILVFISFLIPMIRAYYNLMPELGSIKNVVFANKYFYFLSASFFLISVILFYLSKLMLSKNLETFAFVFAALSIALLLGIFLEYFLADYQKKRLIVFLDPYLDRRGAGYNIIQSKISIGSGGLFGKGIFQGTQSQFGFLPERSTDFIFSLLAEETGFIGSALVVLLYCFFLLRIVWNGLIIKDFFGKLVIFGIFGYFFSQSILNIGMTMGLMPITGVPLPFISYGGSSLLNSIISVMIIENIKMKRYSIE